MWRLWSFKTSRACAPISIAALLSLFSVRPAKTILDVLDSCSIAACDLCEDSSTASMALLALIWCSRTADRNPLVRNETEQILILVPFSKIHLVQHLK